MIRALKTRRNRRRYNPPPGASYVFRWIPPDLLPPGLRDLHDLNDLGDGDGCWWLMALDCFLAGTEDRNAAGVYGPCDMPEADLLDFTWQDFREEVTLTPFGTGTGYWVTLAGDEPGPDPDFGAMLSGAWS